MATDVIVCEPLAGWVPLQPPDALQDVAFDEVHVSVVEPPAATTRGVAANVTVGVTFTVVLAGELVPPGPVQVTTYVVLADNAPVAWVPLVASGPLQPPEAAHEVAFVDVQLKIELDASPTVVGEALSTTVGCDVGAGLSLPPQDANSTTAAASHRE